MLPSDEKCSCIDDIDAEHGHYQSCPVVIEAEACHVLAEWYYSKAKYYGNADYEQVGADLRELEELLRAGEQRLEKILRPLL